MNRRHSCFSMATLYIVDSDTCTSTILGERVFCISIAKMVTRTCRSVTLDLHCLFTSVFYTGVCKDLPYAGYFSNICIPELVYEEDMPSWRVWWRWCRRRGVGVGCCPSVFIICANAEWNSLAFGTKRRAIICHLALC